MWFTRCRIPLKGTLDWILAEAPIFMNVRNELEPSRGVQASRGNPNRRLPALFKTAVILAATAMARVALSSEDVPHRPFAQWADMPKQGQFVAGLVYEESEAYHIWVGGQRHNVTWKAEGEDYGIDINQGYFALQYGIAPRWAADLNLGATTVGWRYFDHGTIRSTTGLMDVAFGVRYQIFQEQPDQSGWMPTLTFRAGAVVPGSYSQSFAFAPGLRSAAIEPELLLRKHFGWPGLGVYGDGLYRWNRTTGNDQYIMSIGLFQQIRGWEIDIGYRHLQTLSGSDIVWVGDGTIIYPRDPRENSDALEAGFSYETSKRRIRYGFNTRTIFDGNNTDAKFWVGGSIDFPLGATQATQ